MENAKGKYTKTEKFYQSLEERTPKFDDINATYYEQFSESGVVSVSSLSQYKSAVRRLSEFIGKDVMTVTVTEIINYLDQFDKEKTRNSQERYIKSFLKYIFINNINKAIEVSNTDVIMALMDEDTKTLIKILMSK